MSTPPEATTPSQMAAAIAPLEPASAPTVANRLECAGEVTLNQRRSLCERHAVGVEQRVEIAAPACASVGLVLLERPGEVATDREAVAGQADRRFEHFCSRPPAEPSVGLEKSRHDGRRRDAKPAAHYWLEAARPAKLRQVEACGHPSVELDCEGLVAGRRVDEKPPITADPAVRWINDAERKSRRDYGVYRRASRDEQIPAGVGRELLRRNQQSAGATRLVSCPRRAAQLGQE